MPRRKSSATPAGQHWRTLGRQPRHRVRDGAHDLNIDFAKQRGDKSHAWGHVYSSTTFHPGGWATEAAALAARPAFKHWVDYEMNQGQRAGQAVSAGRRSPAALGMALSPPAPTRVSSRKRPAVTDVHVGLNMDGGRVKLALTLKPMIDYSVGAEEIARFSQRARGALQRQAKRRRREIESFGLPAGELLSASVWLDIAARCRAAAAARQEPCVPARTAQTDLTGPLRGGVNKGQFLRQKKLIAIVISSQFNPGLSQRELKF